MSRLIPNQFRSQQALLLLTAGLLTAIALMAFLLSTYNNMVARLDDLEQQIFVDQKNVRKLHGLRFQVKQQKQQIGQIEQALFKDNDQDTVTSEMQIKVQAMLQKSGLEPESLRPVNSRAITNTLPSVVLKLRLNGDMDQFISFLVAIYRNRSFFHIEGLTIKPFQQDKLKIYMDLRAYYQPSSNWLTKTLGRK